MTHEQVGRKAGAGAKFKKRQVVKLRGDFQVIQKVYCRPKDHRYLYYLGGEGKPLRSGIWVDEEDLIPLNEAEMGQ